MLMCFGCSWPFAVVKTLRTKVVKGKSIIFLCLIFSGYLSGILYKLISNFDHVTWLYVINGSMVLTEIILYYKFKTRVVCVQTNRARIDRWDVRQARPDENSLLFER